MTDETYSTSRDSDDESLTDESTALTAQAIDDEGLEPRDRTARVGNRHDACTNDRHGPGDRREARSAERRAPATETVREATIGRVEQMASNTGDAIQQTGGGIVETVREQPDPRCDDRIRPVHALEEPPERRRQP